MTKKFSKYLKKKKLIVKKLISTLEKKYDYVSVLATDVRGINIVVDKFSALMQPTNLCECGFVVKVLKEGIYSEFSFNELEEKNFDNIIKNIDYLASIKHNIKEVEVVPFEEEEMVKTFKRAPKGKEYTNDEIINILKNYIDKYKDSKYISNLRLSVENAEISKMFLSTKKDLEQYYTWTTTRTFALARRDSNTKYAYDGVASNNLEDCLLKLDNVLYETINLAVELLDSTLPTPGIYDIIADPSITGLIAHEAFGHGVEMDMFVKDRAQAKEYMNKRVASPLVNMHDGASSTFSVASYFFDDDGVLAHDTKIIDKGILVSGISDVLSASELNTIPTGNGRRENYKHKSYTRMTNTFFEKGNSSLDDMIKSIKQGYLIAVTNNGMEDPKNWGIQCTAHYGREIIDGKFTGKIISPVVMSGYVIDLLNSISAVSKDFVVTGIGSCGKGHKEWVRVSDGGPYLKARVKIG